MIKILSILILPFILTSCLKKSNSLQNIKVVDFTCFIKCIEKEPIDTCIDICEKVIIR